MDRSGSAVPDASSEPIGAFGKTRAYRKSKTRGKGRGTFVVGDASGSRRAENKEAAIRRLERHGVKIVTTEMALFERLGTAEHPRFRDGVALIE